MSATAADTKGITEQRWQQTTQQNTLVGLKAINITLPRHTLDSIKDIILINSTKNAIRELIRLMEYFKDKESAISRAILYCAVWSGAPEIARFIFEYNKELNNIINHPIIITAEETSDIASARYPYTIDGSTTATANHRTAVRARNPFFETGKNPWMVAYPVSWDLTLSKWNRADPETLLGMAVFKAVHLNVVGYLQPHHRAMIKFLIEVKGSNVNARSTFGFSPIEEIYFAFIDTGYQEPIYNENVVRTAFEVVKYLLHWGADWGALHALQIKYDRADFVPNKVRQTREALLGAIENHYGPTNDLYNREKNCFIEHLKKIDYLNINLPKPIKEIIFDYLLHKPINPVSPLLALPPAPPMSLTRPSLIARVTETLGSMSRCDQIFCCATSTILIGLFSTWRIISLQHSLNDAAYAACQSQQPILSAVIDAARNDGRVQAAQNSITNAVQLHCVSIAVAPAALLFSYGIVRCRNRCKAKTAKLLSDRLETRIANRPKLKEE